MAEAEEVFPGVWCAQVPMRGPLRAVNCYLFQGPDGWTIVDTGMNDSLTQGLWAAAFNQLGIAPTDIEKIVVTHYHPDHYGAAGWLQQLTGAPVLMLDQEAAGLPKMYQPPAGRFTQFLLRSGVPEAHREAIVQHQLHTRRRWVVPHPEVTVFSVDSTVRLGRYDFDILFAPGHTDASIVFRCEPAGLTVAGDVVLAGITPNISCFPGFDPDPLGRYLETLEVVARLPADTTLTGHRQPIRDLAGRCGEIVVHHSDRLEHARTLAARGATGWNIAERLFGDMALSSPMFALGEAIAHLEYLVNREVLVRVEDSDQDLYSNVA